MNRISFFVPGVPRPGGSKTSNVIYKNGKPLMAKGTRRDGTSFERIVTATREAGPHTASWRADVKDFATKNYKGEPLIGPIALVVTYVMPRSKGHYGSGRNAGRLKDSAPTFVEKAPDTTKLLRSLEDSLKGICWGDDSQVVGQIAEKVYGTKTGAHVDIVAIAPGTRNWLSAVVPILRERGVCL